MNLSKKVFLFVMLLVVLPQLILAVESKYEFELWNRMTWEDDGSEADPTTSFSVERGYFSIKPKFTDKISGRFTLDIFSSDKDTNGAGLKMKYAYLDFTDLIEDTNTVLSVGLTKHYFGTIYSWKYETIEKDPADKWGFASSTDYGLVLSGIINPAKLTYNLGIYNGEGYKKSGSKVNNEYSYLANLRIKPLDEVELGASYSLNSKNNSQDASGTDNPDYEKINAYAGMAKFHKSSFTLSGQYLGKQVELDNVSASEAVNSQAISLMGIYNLKELAKLDLDLVGRYDMYDPDTDTDDDGENLLLVGLNYYLDKGIQLQANYELSSYEDDDKDNEHTIMLQLRWSFANKLIN